MTKRKFLMLADDYVDGKFDITGWFMSEKLDGMRALWDGGVSRGLPAKAVPWANTAKDARLLVQPTATGLWTRYGHVIHAPDWWLDGLPLGITLDMELWMGRGTFQEMRSVCGSHVPGEGWRRVIGMAFDSPGWHAILADGEISDTNFKAYLDRSMIGFVEDQMVALGLPKLAWGGAGSMESAFQYLKACEKIERRPLRGVTWTALNQEKLPNDLAEARERVRVRLHQVSEGKGEGLILRNHTGPWLAKRVPWSLKAKKLHDAEGTVTGFTWGRETDLGSKLLGKMGALVLEAHTGVRLELSGFTDEERRVSGNGLVCLRDGREIFKQGIDNEGKEETLKDQFWPEHFPLGSKVTYTYTELSNDRVPKFARYLRRAE